MEGLDGQVLFLRLADLVGRSLHGSQWLVDPGGDRSFAGPSADGEVAPKAAESRIGFTIRRLAEPNRLTITVC